MKIIKKTLCFIKSYFLQTVLAFLAYLSFETATDLGFRTVNFTGTFDKYPDIGRESPQATDVAISTGFEGGAIAMGLICCTCIIMIVWLEISKQKKP
tara:strand:+ start:497 stop:787 length:291 start_codon:yes stop_codon:yes gene_type:complete